MKRFRFGLAPLLKVKEQRERLAEARVAQARKEVDLAREQLAHLHSALKDVAGRLERGIGKALPVEAWSSLFAHSSRLERAISEAEVTLHEKERLLRGAIEARTRIATEVEALETLRDQKRAIHRLDEQRSEMERVDEVVMRQWTEAQRRKKGET